MENEEKELEQALQTWKYKGQSDAEFKAKVHGRIHEQFFADNHIESQSSQFFGWIHGLLSHPGYSLASVAAVIAVTIGATLAIQSGQKDNLHPHDGVIPQMFTVVTDPTNAVQSLISKTAGFETLQQPPNWSRESFENALTWVEEEMNLSRQQRIQFHGIHQTYFDQFEILSAQLVQLENEYRHYERERIAGKEIDLLSVYSNFQQQKLVYQQTIQLQQSLIQQVSGFLTPKQQGTYGELFIQHQPPLSIPPSARMEPQIREWQI